MASMVTDSGTITTTHTAFIAAPPRAVYRLIADASRWPYLFAPIVHVERLSAGATEDRLRLWAFGHGAVRTWVSRRWLDRDELRIRFRQERPAPPVASMSGEWVFVPLPNGATSVVLLHEFRAAGDDPAIEALIKQAVDRNSTTELAALKNVAELGERLPGLVHAFADSTVIQADPAQVFDFLYRVQDWPQQLPHVSRVIVDEAVPNLQIVEMDAYSHDGSLQTRNLVRICFPHHGIVFKQIRPPDGLAAHIGAWNLYPTADGVRVTSHNTVLIGQDRAEDLVGTAADRVAELVRQSVRRNCLSILTHAKNAAEIAVAGTAGVTRGTRLGTHSAV